MRSQTDPRLRRARELAKEVRTWAEGQAPKYFFNKNLQGMCGMASGRLAAALLNENFPAYVACNNQHAFVLLGDYVLDVTATQFGIKEKVCVRRLRQTKGVAFWNVLYKFNSRSDFSAFERDSWPIYDVHNYEHIRD